MIRLRLIYYDIVLLYIEYKHQRKRFPKWRRLELVRAGLESLRDWDGSILHVLGNRPESPGDDQYITHNPHHILH